MCWAIEQKKNTYVVTELEPHDINLQLLKVSHTALLGLNGVSEPLRYVSTEEKEGLQGFI